VLDEVVKLQQNRFLFILGCGGALWLCKMTDPGYEHKHVISQPYAGCMPGEEQYLITSPSDLFVSEGPNPADLPLLSGSDMSGKHAQ
jgi:hypothetical protein